MFGQIQIIEFFIIEMSVSTPVLSPKKYDHAALN